MKIQCDMCEKEKATVYCAADEAALCEKCDRNIHNANKLATKHQRFSLLYSSFIDAPICDICKENRALLFCREDRAILCTECDIILHMANEHTQNHKRFLLTGVTLSMNPSSENQPSVSSTRNCDYRHVFNQHNSYNNTSFSLTSTTNYKHIREESCFSTSDTSPEYLMDTLPGWSLEDLLASSASYGHQF